MGLESWVEILPDFSKLDGRVKSHLTSTLSDAGSSGAGSFGRSFKSNVGTIFTGNFLADIAGSFARGVGELIGTGIRAGIDYSLGSIDLASSLSEQVNAVQVAFGKDIGGEVLGMSDKIANSLNITRLEFSKTAVQFSAFAKTIGGSDAAQVIEDLTRRGADFASVYDIEVGDALALFQSGLAGETEPLRKFGLDLSAAAVSAYAVKAGITDGTRELTEAEKVQARYGLLLEQTLQTEGDLANTRGSLANQQRQLNVALTEAQTKFGEALLPTALDVVTFANQELIPILTDALSTAGPALTASIEGVLPEIKELLGSAAESLPAAIELAVGAASLAAESAEGDLQFFSDTQEVFERTDAFFTEYLPKWAAGSVTVEESWDGFFNWWDLAWDGIANTTANKSDEIKNYWVNSVSQTVLELNAKGAEFVGIGNHYGDGLAEGLRQRISTVREAAAQLANEAIFTSRQVAGIKSPSTVMRRIGGYYGEGLALGLTDSTGMVSTAAAQMAGAGLIGPRGDLSADISVAGTGVGSSVFPSQVTLVDSSGALLGRMDVLIGDYDSGRYQATRGGKIK